MRTMIFIFAATILAASAGAQNQKVISTTDTTISRSNADSTVSDVTKDVERKAKNRKVDTRSPGTNGGTNPPINPTTGHP